MLLALVLAAAPYSDALKQYGDLEYEACVSSLSNVRGLSTRDRAPGELLLGLCHFALGHEAQARSAIESAIRRDPSVRAPSTASPKEAAFIENVRTTMPAAEPTPRTKRVAKKEPEPVRVDDEPRPVDVPVVAKAEPVLTPATTAATPAPIVVTAPIVEQAPKATWLPWAVGGLAVASAGLGAGLGLNAKNLETSARAAPVQLDAARLRGEAESSATAANVAFAVAGTAAVGAVVSFILTR